MKNFTYSLLALLLLFANTYGQQEKGIYGESNWLHNWTEFQPIEEEYDEPTVILTGNITEDMTLKKREVYLLLGSVFVVNNATLTIEPGTVILGDWESKGSLTITKGASIVADGLETDPIVFSSNRGIKRAGDWGGLFILGNAPTGHYGNGALGGYHDNIKSDSYSYLSYGGDNENDTSGILKYVRIEFAGKRNKEEGYSNGLLLAGVGQMTILENIMVSYSAGDSFETWGGNISIDKAVSFKSNGNDFHINYGTQCQLNNSLAVRSSYISNRNGPKSLVVKSYNAKNEFDFSKKPTKVVAKNITLLNDSDNLNQDIEMGLVKEGIFVGSDAILDMTKSVVSGFNPAVKLQSNITVNQENLDKIKFSNMYFNNCNGNIFLEGNQNNDDLEDWYGNRAFYNVYSKGSNFETFINTRSDKRPDYRLQINRIVTATDKEIDD